MSRMSEVPLGLQGTMQLEAVGLESRQVERPGLGSSRSSRRLHGGCRWCG